jgi:hypothetical protein
MIKSFFISFIVLLVAHSSFSQNNNIELEIVKLNFNTKYSNRYIKYASLKYNRYINQNFLLGINLSPKIFNYKYAFWSANGYDSLGLNTITKSGNIHFATLSISYFKTLSRFDFFLNSGLATAWSRDFYMTELVLAPPPPFGEGDVIWLDGNWKRTLYFGVPFGIKIGYPIFKNKLSINGNLNYTKYLKNFPSTYSYGLSINYKF